MTQLDCGLAFVFKKMQLLLSLKRFVLFPIKEEKTKDSGTSKNCKPHFVQFSHSVMTACHYRIPQHARFPAPSSLPSSNLCPDWKVLSNLIFYQFSPIVSAQSFQRKSFVAQVAKIWSSQNLFIIYFYFIQLFILI